MLNRRTFLAAVALTATMTFNAQAADWSKDYPEIVLGVIPAENASTTSTVMRLWLPISARNSAPR